MKKSIILILIVLTAVSSCQNKIAAEKEYATTVGGIITKPAVTHAGRDPVNGAVITDGKITAVSDSSGRYSLTVFHNGAFILQISYKGYASYNEIIYTTSESLKVDHDY